jgi:hypothetical protein
VPATDPVGRAEASLSSRIDGAAARPCPAGAEDVARSGGGRENEGVFDVRGQGTEVVAQRKGTRAVPSGVQKPVPSAGVAELGEEVGRVSREVGR